MKPYLKIIMILFINLYGLNAYADDTVRPRPHKFKFHVVAFETITYPVNSNKKLHFHRHEHDRIIVALTSGRLKVITKNGKSHFIHLRKNQIYYLKRNIAGELHANRNASNHPIKVMVMEVF